MSTEFLDDGDLERLTGYVRRTKQIAWLEENGIPFVVNSCGCPVVRRDMREALPEPELGPIP